MSQDYCTMNVITARKI